VLLEVERAPEMLATVQPSHFWYEPHQRIARAIRELNAAGNSCDVVSVISWLTSRGEMHTGLSVEYVKDLPFEVPHGFHAPYYAKVVSEHYQLRNLLYRFEDGRRMACAPGAIVQDVLDYADGLGAFVRDEIEVKFTPKALTMADLWSTDFTVDYFIEGAAVVGQPGILGAPSKSLKTVIASAAAMSITSGRPFLGKFPVLRRARCCVVSAESGFSALQSVTKRIAAAEDAMLDEFSGILWIDRVIDLGDKAQVRWLKRFVTDNRTEFLILDPAYLMMPGLGDGANNLFSSARYLFELTTLVQECSCTVFLVHHFRRTIGEPFQQPELEWLAHAGFPNWARWWWLINRRSKYDPEKRGLHELWLNLGGSAGHSSAWAVDVDEGLSTGHRWDVSIRPASDARRERDERDASEAQDRKEAVDAQIREKNRAKILNTMRVRAYRNPATKNSIIVAAGLSKAVGQPMFEELVEAGEIVMFPNACRLANGHRHDGFLLRSTNIGTAGQLPFLPLVTNGEHADTETAGQPPLKGVVPVPLLCPVSAGQRDNAAGQTVCPAGREDQE
jgi:hypothetical protein